MFGNASQVGISSSCVRIAMITPSRYKTRREKIEEIIVKLSYLVSEIETIKEEE